SIVEAMGSGVPVVATTNGGPREITDYGRVGLLADPLDPLELASQLLKLVSSREEHAYFSAAGRARVLERYSWECTAKGYARLAEELVGCERRSAASAYSGVSDTPIHLESGASLPLLGRWTRRSTSWAALGLPLQGYSRLEAASAPPRRTDIATAGMMG
ncbi:MAG: glycosyltransferase, partial [Chloroflexia bacterium]